MEEIAELKRRLAEERPQAWDAFPDIGLYMDQIISYMPRQLIHFDEGESLTSAMVNNYIKDGMLPRAEGKRSVKDASSLIAAGTSVPDKDAEALYAHFCRELDAALNETAQSLAEDVGEEELPRLALALALRSYADKLACQRVLEILQERRPLLEKSKEKTKKCPKSENE